jgi:hypothetical protein
MEDGVKINVKNSKLKTKYTGWPIETVNVPTGLTFCRRLAIGWLAIPG